MSSYMHMTVPNTQHRFSAYYANPVNDGREAKAGLVMIQEIFGVNEGIRKLARRFCEAGYHTLSPCIFDRIAKGMTFGYTEEEVQAAIKAAREDTKPEDAMADLQCTVDSLKKYHDHVFVTGFCFGGTLSWAAAANVTGLSGAVCYYGGQIAQMTDLKPQIPVMMHFGEKDAGIPLDDIEKIKAAHPDIPVHVHAGADHGFSSDRPIHFHEQADATAFQQTMDFFDAQMG